MESKIIRIWRTRLPHWEVRNARYFVTIRCANSLPRSVVLRLGEIQDSLQKLEARSAQFAQLQRKYFGIMERYLDRGTGFTPFDDYSRQRLGLEVIEDSLYKDGWKAGSMVLMPNHCHAVLRRIESDGQDLEHCLKRLKGRVSRALNQNIGRSGRFWQRDWFDRWIRNDAEYERTQTYVANNPVRAGLAKTAEAYAGYRKGDV